MPAGYPLLHGECMGGGERAPVALCREPTEPAGETRGWEAHSFSRQQARPGGGYSKIDPLGSEDHRAGFILLSCAGKRDGSKHRKLM